MATGARDARLTGIAHENSRQPLQQRRYKRRVCFRSDDDPNWNITTGQKKRLTVSPASLFVFKNESDSQFPVALVLFGCLRFAIRTLCYRTGRDGLATVRFIGIKGRSFGTATNAIVLAN